MPPPFLAHTETRPARLYRLDATSLAQEELGQSFEWLESDGHGGFAASTPGMLATRRYHGWLLQAPRAGAKRHLLVAGCAEKLWVAGQAYCLPSGALDGQERALPAFELESFEGAPYPRAVYRLGKLEIVRELLLSRHDAGLLVRYRLQGFDEGATLELRPLFAFREADALTFENAVLDPTLHAQGSAWLFRPYASLPPLAMRFDSPACTFRAEPRWQKSQTYTVDIERGYAGQEDHFAPGIFRIGLGAETEVVQSYRLHQESSAPRLLFARESREREARARSTGQSFAGRLALAADDFLYRTPAGRLGVLAGYPWFEEWGRDTFVALPGLTLARGRSDLCGEVLSGALSFLRNGLMPNVFGDKPETSAYNSADAALWFARAVGLYRRAGGVEARLIEEYRPALEAIVQSYREPNELGMLVDASGLLWAGSPLHNATWMDARTAQGPVTPRAGCAVELNALWIELLAELEQLQRLAGDAGAANESRAQREQSGRAFRQYFWLAEAGRLADLWDGQVHDSALRPNMVIAAALESVPLSPNERAQIVASASRALLTPRGLRTLAVDDPAYRGRYHGGPEERDRAYHQGTAWPWLFGFYVEACLRAAVDRRTRVAELRQAWAAFAVELERSGLNHISEVFDGDLPQRAGGTFAQAWNTAELLRADALLAEALA